MAFDWDDVRLFLAIHRAKSLTSAGKTLGADQSTMGRRLVAFERNIGAKLFFRTPAGFVATPAGEKLARHAEEMEERAIAIDREIVGAEATLEGTLRLTTADAFGSVIVTPLLSKFHAKWPTISLELVANNTLLSLSKREADMAIRFNRTKDSGLVMRRLADVGSGLYASRDYVERMGMPPPDYRGHFFVGIDEVSTDARWLDDEVQKGRYSIRSNATLAQLEAMKAGMGIAFLPSYLVTDLLDVVVVKPPSETIMRSIWLLIHEDLQHAARVRACADFLVTELGKLAPRLRGDPTRRRVK